jgi:hypothetical protein
VAEGKRKEEAFCKVMLRPTLVERRSTAPIADAGKHRRAVPVDMIAAK